MCNWCINGYVHENLRIKLHCSGTTYRVLSLSVRLWKDYPALVEFIRTHLISPWTPKKSYSLANNFILRRFGTILKLILITKLWQSCLLVSSSFVLYYSWSHTWFHTWFILDSFRDYNERKGKNVSLLEAQFCLLPTLVSSIIILLLF